VQQLLVHLKSSWRLQVLQHTMVLWLVRPAAAVLEV
jgi:hypothetical protein